MKKLQNSHLPAARNAPPALSKRRRIRRLLFIVVTPLAVALFYLLPALALREPKLMDKAHKVPETDVSGYKLEQFVWRPDGAIIEQRQINSRRAEITHIDARTGANTTLRVLAPELSHDISNYTLEANLSPDGQNLLLREVRNRMVHYTAYPILQGTRRDWLPVPLTMNHNQVWLPDSSGWLEGVQTGKTLTLTVHPVQGALIAPSITLPWNAKAWPGFSVSSTGVLLYAAYVDAPPPQSRVHCWRINATTNKIETSSFTLSIPGGVDQVGDIVLSPKGDRVVFSAIRLAKPNFLLKWLHLANMDPHGAYTVESISFWTCRTDGTEIHELGFVPEAERTSGLRDLAWTPDGKAICFRTDDAIYTVPVE